MKCVVHRTMIGMEQANNGTIKNWYRVTKLSFLKRNYKKHDNISENRTKKDRHCTGNTVLPRCWNTGQVGSQGLVTVRVITNGRSQPLEVNGYFFPPEEMLQSQSGYGLRSLLMIISNPVWSYYSRPFIWEPSNFWWIPVLSAFSQTSFPTSNKDVLF